MQLYHIYKKRNTSLLHKVFVLYLSIIAPTCFSPSSWLSSCSSSDF